MRLKTTREQVMIDSSCSSALFYAQQYLPLLQPGRSTHNIR